MKHRYELLDGLRGVAALMVIIYHVFECFPADTWIIGHGYLAVDFFFILSGFVIGYAYDHSWKPSTHRHTMTIGKFFRRRLIRLHPMVIFGVLMGLGCFLLLGGVSWDGTKASTSAILWATLMGLFLIPCVPGGAAEVRGNGEMFPLNGPHWSLFFEYIGNIMYALFIHRFSTRVLAVWTALLGILFAWFFTTDVVGYGNIGVGWTLADNNLWGGLLRMSFSYSVGLLLSRWFHADKSRRGALGDVFWSCSLLIAVAMAVPCLGVEDKAWMNCLYEVFIVMLLFPAVVWMAACGTTGTRRSSKLCTFLGGISYPLYAVHYPLMYIFYAYIGFPETWRTPAECWPIMVGLVVLNLTLAYLALTFYDRPIRHWLKRKMR